MLAQRGTFEHNTGTTQNTTSVMVVHMHCFPTRLLGRSGVPRVWCHVDVGGNHWKGGGLSLGQPLSVSRRGLAPCATWQIRVIVAIEVLKWEKGGREYNVMRAGGREGVQEGGREIVHE